MTIEYQVHEMDAVWRYFVDGFKLPPNKKIHTFEAFHDSSKGQVVFQLIIDDLTPASATPK